MMKSIVAWLRRHVKNQKPAREGANDGLSRLPLELHFYVLEHLEPQDFVLALNVCRSWRYIWLSEEVWPSLAARWFPGLREQIVSAAAPGQERGVIFRNVLVKNLLRNQGKFSCALYHRLDLETERFFKLSKAVSAEDGGVHRYSDVREPEPDLARFARFRVYNSGRIAWWPESYALPYIAVIDDLATRSRRVYSFPDHRGDQSGYQITMGNQLFIMGKERTLHVWHLETNSYHKVELPYDFKRCLTEGETVLVIAKDSTVYLWDFGQQVRQIDMSNIYQKAPVTWGDQGNFVPGILGPHRVGLWLGNANVAIDFIIHPTQKSHFFVVMLAVGSLTVHEVDSGTLVNSYTMSGDMLSRRALELSKQLRWEKINSVGGYNLLSIYPMRTPHEQHDLLEVCHEISCHCRTSQAEANRHTLVSVCFNIYTKSFDILRHVPYTSCEPRTFHIWNNSLLGAANPYGRSGCQVVSLKACTDGQGEEPLGAIPCYSTTMNSQPAETSLFKRCRLPPDEMVKLGALTKSDGLSDDLQYFLDGNTGIVSCCPVSVQRSSPDMMRIVGDDDFLVLFEDGIYCAWMFGDVASRR